LKRKSQNYFFSQKLFMATESSIEQEEDYPYAFFSDKRHQSLLSTSSRKEIQHTKTLDWRIREKIKTVSVSLVLCLNIGVDPPDLVKTKPCAKMECWIDPFLLPGSFFFLN
jgi:regulator-associated protein of mTOR